MLKVYRESDFFDKEEKIYAFFSLADVIRNMHAHEFWEIAYVYEGEAQNETIHGSQHLQTGDFLFIKPGAEHSFTYNTNDVRGRMCNCLIRRNYFERLIEKFQNNHELSGYKLYELLSNSMPFCIHLSDDNANNIRHLIWQIAHEYNHFTVGSSYIIENALINLLVYMTRIYEYQQEKVTSPVSKHRDIDELIKYMNSNFGQELTLEYLAARQHLSKEYLSRYFKKETGKNISEYLSEIRISRAKGMLHTDTFPIGFISEYCGYRTISAFEKAFKKIVGMSPSDYRKSSQKSS